MKNIAITIILLTFLNVSNFSFARHVNWRALKDGHNHLINLNVGFDYGATIGIGYGHKLNTKLPLVLNMEYSFPAGQKLFDDFKTKLGGQAEVLRLNNFSTTLKAYGIFRRYESESARLINFGSEFSSLFGYYKPTWYVAGELGFDKAITTHVKHGAIMKENYPGIQDGWYIPTGGNFFYGIQSGRTFKNNDVYLKVGKTATQDFKNTAIIPLYFQLGFNSKF